MRLFYSTIVVFLLLLSATTLSKAQPVANFSASVTSGCSPIVVQFSDLSTGTPTSWSWNLGNGATSTLKNPSTTYLTPGTYNVSLTVSNNGGSDTKTVSGYITVVPSPTISFAADDSLAGCAPRVVNFSTSVTPGVNGPVSYAWDFGDGTTSTQENPTHLYQNTGVYTVTFVTTNSSGCSKTLVKNNYIQAVTTPVPSFTASNAAGCVAPLNVSFTNTSTGAINYLWKFGDGGTSTAASPTHIYTTAGSYNVQLIANAQGTCTDTITVPNKVVIASPSASFSTNTTTICPGNSIHFTNNSTPSTATTSWNFGDGTSSTQTNPNHVYTTAGNYIAKLYVTQGSCTDSTTTNIVVNSKPQVQFTANTTTSCSAPFSVNFSNSTTNANSYIWLFGDGSSSTLANPSHTYTTNGNFTVKLIAFNASGCSDTLIKSNYIHIQPVTSSINLSQASTCAPSPVGFYVTTNSTTTISNYTWNFGDGSSNSTNATPTHTYNNPGAYTVTVSGTDANGCPFSAANTVPVNATPNASFTASTNSSCFASPVIFTSTSTNATAYSWNFGDGGFSTSSVDTHYFNALGNFTITLIATNGTCSDTSSITNMVNIYGAMPGMDYSINCTNRNTVSFLNQAYGAVSSLSWNFGDGTPSTSTANPTHTYASYGKYGVTMTVSGSNCTSSRIDTIEVFPLVTDFATQDTLICKGLASNFHRQGGNSYPTNYTWNFGDGTTINSNNTSISHAYLQPGSYSVKLRASDSFGCKDSLVKTNYIKVNGPVANFITSSATGCSPLAVSFTDQSTITTGSSIVQKKWYFGDGTNNIGLATNVNHTYYAGNATNYTVKLVIEDNAGCKDSIASQVVSVTKPTAKFTASATNVCKGATVSFTNQTIAGNANYLWSFGDGASSTAANPTHAYTTAGVYSVKLIAWDQNACSDTIIKNNYITVTAINPSFMMSDSVASCPPLLVNFTNNSTGANNYSWSFGNNSTSVLTNPSTLYTIPGTFTVKLKASSNAGCVDSAMKTVTIDGPYGTLTYTPTSGCSPLGVQFTSVATNTLTYTWDMNNGTTITTNSGNFNYTYSSPGEYLPVLVLGNSNNCNVAIQGTDTIRVDSLSADFSYSNTATCRNDVIQFVDTLYHTYSQNVARSWVFGDGGTSTAHNPTHVYANSGTYTVQLIVGNSFGCQDTIVHSITIDPLPVLTVTPATTICGIGNNATLTVSGASTYIWSPGSNLSCTSCASTIATPLSSTTYTVSGTDTNGCVNTANVPVSVGAFPLAAATPDTAICTGKTVTLNANGGVTYSWAPSTGLSCTNCSSPTVTPAATTTYTVIANSQIGCTDTATVTVTVKPLPTVTTSGNQSICYGDEAKIAASGAATYTWSPAGSLSCSNCATPTATPTATTTYAVTGVDGNGCANTSQLTVKVNGLPKVDAGPDQTICAGITANLAATGANNYTWTTSTALSCTNCAQPKATPASDITYVVTGMDANGCTGKDSVTITVIERVPTSVGPTLDICKGETTQLKATGGISYSWSPAPTLNDSHAASPTAFPEETTRYKVFIKQNECFTDTLTQKVNVHAVPTVQLGPDKSTFEGEDVQLSLTSTNATAYEWYPQTGLSCAYCYNPVAKVYENTTYTVTATNESGCSATDDITITMKCDNSMIFIPNTFTPNGDGNNDVFFPNSKGIRSAAHFKVFNRWGELVFSVDNMPFNDPSYGWNGQFRGKMLKPDTYVYLLEATCTNGEPIQLKGDISLVR